jgi:uncharacterized protein DUF4247
MSRLAGPVLFLAFVGLTLLAVFVEEQRIHTPAILLALAALIAGFVAMPAARAALADRFPRIAWLGRTVMALRWRTIGLVFAGCVAALVLAEVVEDAVEPPGRLADHLAATYPGMHDARPPLELSVELDDAWPPEDQRYTAVGVLLRYEHDIVALVPDGRGGTTIERHRADEGYRRFYAYVGSYWGARYSRRDDAPRSAMAVPDVADTRAVSRRLRLAGRVQNVCYGWDVEIRSGEREGRFTGPPIRRDCRYVKLYGWIDPNAGRLTRKGSPGEWSLGYEWTLDGELREASINAIDTPLVELIEGAMQQPAGDGHRAGKGLVEHLDVLPLLAQDVPGIARVFPGTPIGAPDNARPAPVELTDAERRLEDSWEAIPIAFVRVGAIFTLAFLFLGLIAAAIVRVVRRVRA